MATVDQKPYPPIPYGMADFRSIRREGFLYVDKTRFVRDLENERYAFFLRPRRFGKTCWLSVLEHYYDRTRKDGFEATFAETAIGRDPTANRSSYAVLRLNFSAFSKRLSTLEERFEEYCHTRLRGMLETNADVFSEALTQRILALPTTGGRLNELFLHAERLGVRLFLLIDEYDNFANTILAGEGEAAYRQLTHGGGFFRDFFATVKTGTESGSLERLVHHRGLAGDDGRRDEWLQHRKEHQLPGQVQRSRGLHRGGSARGWWPGTANSACSTRGLMRRWP